MKDCKKYFLLELQYFLKLADDPLCNALECVLGKPAAVAELRCRENMMVGDHIEQLNQSLNVRF